MFSVNRKKKVTKKAGRSLGNEQNIRCHYKYLFFLVMRSSFGLTSPFTSSLVEDVHKEKDTSSLVEDVHKEKDKDISAANCK
mmetsp:Transcript_11603/g.16236  ORF Transcript_11603/g.16236 Transcript_11603/m.16236 type:complete len:82 (+) Transcript_11603:3600-3845(+)